MAEIQQSIVGFELGPAIPPTGNTFGWLAEAASQGYLTTDITAGSKRSGTYGFDANVVAAAGKNARIRLLPANTGLPSDVWEMRVRFYFRIVTTPDANGLVVAWTGSGSVCFELQLQMNTSRELRVVPSFVGGTTTAYQGTFATDTWYQVRMRFYGEGTGGQVGANKSSSYELIVYSEDGSTELASFSESQPLGNNMPDKWPALFDLGQSSGIGGPSCTRRLYYDDWWCHMATAAEVADMEWPRGTAVQGYVPTANGSSNQFSRGGTDTGANWSQVNDIPLDTSGSNSYVFSSTAGHVDMYQHANLADADDVVYHIQALCFLFDTTTPQELIIGATTYSVETHDGGASRYAIAHQIYSNAAALSSTDFNALQFGIKKTVAGGTTLFSGQEFLEVLTGPPNVIEEDLDGSDWTVTLGYDAIGGLEYGGDAMSVTFATGVLGFRLGNQGVEINVPTTWQLQRLDVGYRSEETS